MKSFIFLVFIICFATLFTACHKDSDSSDKVEIINEFSAVVYDEITGSIAGTVSDNDGKPLPDVIVQIYSGQTKTNKDGVFVFKNVKLDRQGTFIRAQKNGYIVSGDYIYPEKKGYSRSDIRMYKLDKSKILNAGLGGKIIAGADGASIVFKPKSILTLSGEEFNGNVYVTAEYIDPKDDDLYHKMPGGLQATNSKGNTVVLGTIGMLAVELRDGNGNELKLDPNKPAQINIPVHTQYSPTTIPLWYFDELKGWWVEEGVATLVGGYYTGEVKHFSFWNCDAPFPLVQIQGRVLDQNGNPASVLVSISVDGLGTYGSMTNSDGYFGGKVPKGKILTINIKKYRCYEIIKTLSVGPFDTDVNLDNIVINVEPLEKYEISGTITCSGSTISDGVAVININGYNYPILSEENGTFIFDYTHFNCITPLAVKIFAFRNSDGKSSPIFPVTEKIVENINLDVCSTTTCTFAPTLTLTCDSAIVTIDGGSGNFSYEWTHGISQNTSSVSLLDVDSLDIGTPICVIITDNNVANCKTILCQANKGILSVNSEKDCGEVGSNNGAINLYAWNGSQAGTYSYRWSNGATTEAISDLAPGKYCATVTDQNGCTRENCTIIEPLEVTGVKSCNGNIYNIESTNFAYGVLYAQGPGQANINYPMEIDVTFAGYYISGTIYGNGGCSHQFAKRLPMLVNASDFKLNSAIKPSCPMCTDGKITYTLNSNGDCYNCKIGAVKLFKKDNLNEDLFNSINNLGKGNYYLVLTDENTGCWISHFDVYL